MQQTWLECIRCGRKYPMNEVKYRCESCGGLLDVEHNVDALKSRSAAEWKDLFWRRSRVSQWPYQSGVWAKKEWVAPQVDDENIVSLGEGYTPLLQAKNLAGMPEVWVKECGISHTGSFKDLGMTVLVSHVKQLISQGTKIRAVACASTGDTSAALAAYAAAAGIPAIIFLPRGKTSTAQLAQPIAHGAIVLGLETDFDGCMEIVQDITADESIYLANSMNALRIEGQKTVGIEIVQQLSWEAPDWIVIPAGNLGNISALGRGLMMMYELGLVDRLPRIVAAQAENANPLYRSFLTGFKDYQAVQAQRTLASAIQIGAPVSYERAVKALRAFDGIVEQASEDELANAAALADRAGLYACPQTGVALAVLQKLARQGTIKESERVVVISTAHGLKFTDSKVNYHDGALADVIARYANPPTYLEADIDAVCERLAAEIDRR
ncbi:MAG TPA: threonine synthase [Candidatus Acetothermia bacterium]|nr:threonine synthase [Candidatus Acetothermia bacterium]